MKKLISANWKMYKSGAEAAQTIKELTQALNSSCPEDREVLIFAPFTALASAMEAIKSLPCGQIGAQNFYPAENGAFTGEISLPMLKEYSINWVLTGHSERRKIFAECDQFIGTKTAYALKAGFKVVLCIGETLEEREAGQLQSVLEKQITQGLDDVPQDLDPANLAVAYEPVWAIGTGKTAQTDDILDAHAKTRALLVKTLGAKGQQVRILYGGSVKADNASAILPLDNVDGVLVGGASLQADSFAKIITA